MLKYLNRKLTLKFRQMKAMRKMEKVANILNKVTTVILTSLFIWMVIRLVISFFHL